MDFVHKEANLFNQQDFLKEDILKEVLLHSNQGAPAQDLVGLSLLCYGRLSLLCYAHDQTLDCDARPWTVIATSTSSWRHLGTSCICAVQADSTSQVGEGWKTLTVAHCLKVISRIQERTVARNFCRFSSEALQSL